MNLAATVDNTPCDSVVVTMPIYLGRIIKMSSKPNTRVAYDLQEIGSPDLSGVVDGFIKKAALR